MALSAAIEQWKHYGHCYFAWSRDLAWPEKLLLSAAMACLTGLAAQIRIPHPYSPVPITGQVFAVLLSGVLIGAHFGALSQILYVAGGVAGIPWFTGTSLALTGGYLVGFMPAAFLVGWFTDRHVAARRFWPQLGLMMAAVLVIYSFGTPVLALSTRSSFLMAIQAGALPFIPFDVLKAVAAALISCHLLPKEAART